MDSSRDDVQIIPGPTEKNNNKSRETKQNNMQTYEHYPTLLQNEMQLADQSNNVATMSPSIELGTQPPSLCAASCTAHPKENEELLSTSLSTTNDSNQNEPPMPEV